MRWKKIENYCCNWMCLHLSFFHFLVPQSKRERLGRKPGGSAFFPVCQIHVLAALSAWWHTSISKLKYAQLNSLSSPACMLVPFIPNICITVLSQPTRQKTWDLSLVPPLLNPASNSSWKPDSTPSHLTNLLHFSIFPNIHLVPNWSVVLSSSISPLPRHQRPLWNANRYICLPCVRN